MRSQTYLLAAAVSILVTGVAAAATFNVNSTADEVDANPGDGACVTAGGACTVRAAVMEANALAGDDDILIPAGTYALTIPADSGGDADGDLDVTDNLTVTGAGTADTTIDASAMNRMFLVSTGVSLTLASMTLDAVDVTAQSQDGLLVEGQDGSSLTFHDLTILPVGTDTNSSTAFSLIRHTGVGFAASSVSWTSDFVLYFLDHEPAGGADAAVILEDVSLGAPPSPQEVPALLRLNAPIPTTVDISDSLVDGTNSPSCCAQAAINISAPDPGALLDVTITDTQIIDWHTSGIVLGPNAGTTNADIARVTVTNQQASALGYGSLASGGILVEDSLMATASSSFQLFRDVPTIFRNSTIIVAEGSGVFELKVGAVYNSTVVATTLQNDIDLTLRNSVLTGPCESSTPNIVSEGYNLIADTTNCTITGDTTGNILNVDPELDILADNGGPTETMHPLAGSPLLDAGNPATPGSGGTACEATDQRGVSRPQDGTGDTSAVCDIGAVESMGVPDPVLDFGDAPWPYPTLEEDDGARHRVSTLLLGTGVSAEEDGLPDPDAEGDNLDDGLTFLDAFVPGSMSEVEVTVSEDAALEMWWDFGQDGTWDDPGDQQPVQQSISAGTSSFLIDVPDSAPTGEVFVRARVSSVAMNPTGSAPDGEVEDYKITVLEPPFVRAFAGPSRDVAVGGSVVIGGDPAADGGTPPYTFDWTLIGGDGATFSVDSTTIPNPTVTATSEGFIDACLEVTDSMPSMDTDCTEVNIFCAETVNQDPMFTADSGVEDYWGEDSVESEEYTVMFGGDVIFHSGDKVVLGDGFKVESGGTFAVDIDPNINMGCAQ